MFLLGVSYDGFRLRLEMITLMDFLLYVTKLKATYTNSIWIHTY